jgi:biopolymer transport protein ExbD
MRLKKFDSMNVIPFIDIMLVLLVIVLTFSTFIAQGKIELTLPKASSATKSDIKFVEIIIDKDQVLHFNSKVIDMNDLQGELLNFPKESSISLKSDENVPFKLFIKVVDILKSLKFEKISIITEIEQ